MILKKVNMSLKTTVSMCSIQRVVLRSKQSEDSWQKEGRLSSFREEPCRQCSTKPWQLHERPREKLSMKPWKLRTWRIRKSVVLTMQHEVAKVTRKTRRRVVIIVLYGAWELLEGPWENSCTKPRRLHRKKSCWQCSTKPRKLQERFGEELLKWNWLGYILPK